VIDRETIFVAAVTEIRRHAANVLAVARSEGEHIDVLVAQEIERIADNAIAFDPFAGDPFPEDRARTVDEEAIKAPVEDEEDAGMAGHEDAEGTEPAEVVPMSPEALRALEQWAGDAALSVAAVYANVFGVAPAVGLDTDAQFAELVDRVGDEDAWILVKRELFDQETRRAIDGKPDAGV